MITFLDFEKPIAELSARVRELREASAEGAIDLDIDAEIARLDAKAERALRETYARLTPWQKTQVARHPSRPHFKHYVGQLIEDFMPLAGDRAFADDQAILGGLGRLNGRRVVVGVLGMHQQVRMLHVRLGVMTLRRAEVMRLMVHAHVRGVVGVTGCQRIGAGHEVLSGHPVETIRRKR